MNLTIASSSAVIVQRVPAEIADTFLQIQREICAVAQKFPGYVGTDVYPPLAGQSDEFVTVLHFASEGALRAWLASAERAKCIDKLRQVVGDFELRPLSGGFRMWFEEAEAQSAAPLPGWKMVLTVLLGLYPTVLSLTLFLGPITAPLGFAVSLLIGNALSVMLLQWCVVPMLTHALRPWLTSNTAAARATSLAGGAGIVLVLASIALFVRLVHGS